MAEPKITSKNLAYASDLPPFLARLRGQQQQHRDSDSPDPILAARRRAAKPRSASEEAEDVPLVVDEEGNTIAFPGADADVATEANGGDDVEGRKGEELDKQKEKEREKVAGIGAGKKRKVGRIVGGDEDESQTAAATNRAKGEHPSTTKKSVDSGSKDTKSSTKQGKKKAKKIKLSFGDDGD